MRFTKGLAIVNTRFNRVPNESTTIPSKVEAAKFQSQPTVFPTNNSNTLPTNAPSRGKIRETKKASKIESINAASVWMYGEFHARKLRMKNPEKPKNK